MMTTNELAAAPQPVRFDCSRVESDLITRIVRRAVLAGYIDDTPNALRRATMDITACHCNGCPLKLYDMLTMPEPDFGHDFNGIQRYIDRSTGKLTDHFDPRCSAPAPFDPYSGR